MPTDEQRALWAAIRAAPDDDTARLVYADWLQENGDEPRAEFIRLQIALPGMYSARPPGQRRPPEVGASTARCEQLLGPNRTRWVADFMQTIRPQLDSRDPRAMKEMRTRRSGLRFHRGFLYTSLNAAELPLVLAAESHIEPFESFGISLDWQADGERLFPALGRSPLAACVGYLFLSAADDGTARALAASGCLSRVGSLSIHRGGLTDAGLAAIAGASASRLHSLDLEHNLVGDEGAAALARSPLLSGVTSLDLSGNSIGDAGAIALAESRHLSRVVFLRAEGNPIGPVGLRRLWERFEGRVSPRRPTT